MSQFTELFAAPCTTRAWKPRLFTLIPSTVDSPETQCQFTNFAPKFDHVCVYVFFFADIKIRRSAFSNFLNKILPMQNLNREMVMENQERVMKKSREQFCKVCEPWLMAAPWYNSLQAKIGVHSSSIWVDLWLDSARKCLSSRNCSLRLAQEECLKTKPFTLIPSPVDSPKTQCHRTCFEVTMATSVMFQIQLKRLSSHLRGPLFLRDEMEERCRRGFHDSETYADGRRNEMFTQSLWKPPLLIGTDQWVLKAFFGHKKQAESFV